MSNKTFLHINSLLFKFYLPKKSYIIFFFKKKAISLICNNAVFWLPKQFIEIFL